MAKKSVKMLQALILAKKVNDWVPTSTFKKARISKRILDELVDQEKLKVRRRRTKYLYVKRTDERYFDPIGKDTALNTEIAILLGHADVNQRVRNIVIEQLGVSPTMSLADINAIFMGLKRLDRARTYNVILRGVQERKLKSTLYNYQTVTYHTPSNYYKITDIGEAYLNSLL